jgi:beta-glucosidase
VDLYGFPRPQLGPATGPDSDQGVFAGGQGSSYANLPYLITPFEALQQRARQCGSQVFGYFDNYNHSVQASYAAKANAVGAPCLVDVRQQCSEGYDRANLSASWEGDQTILAVAGRCNQTVVLYSACGPFNVTSWVDHPNVTAIINAGGAGQEAGNALVDVLYGDVNPSARLPYTVAYQVSVRTTDSGCSC